MRIRDTGIGIAADALPHIFTMFVQRSPTSRRNQNGLGVGLTLAQQIVELHGGRIEARSEGIDKGSKFTVYLPVAGTEGTP